MLVGLLAGVPPENAARLLALKRQVQTHIAGGPGVYGIAFRNFQSGESLSINEDDRTHAASLMKVPVMMAAFELAGRGELDLDQPIVVREEFRSLIGGAPFRVPIEQASSLYRHRGAHMPLRDLIGAMITRSDNTATNLVIEQVGAERVNDLARRLGTRNTKILRGVEDHRAYDAGLNNETSAADMLTLLAACRESPLFTAADRQEMMAILRRQQHRSMVAKGIPEGVGALIANKTGSISWVEYDAAIVDLPDGRSYGLVIMIHDFADKRYAAISAGTAISQTIWKHVSGR